MFFTIALLFFTVFTIRHVIMGGGKKSAHSVIGSSEA